MKHENDVYKIEGSEEPGCLLSLKIIIKPLQTQKIFKKAIKKINKEISIPGFRKGKAPDETVISRYSSYVDQEWKELLVNDAYKAALDLTQVYPLRKESIQKPKVESCSQKDGAVVLLSYEHYPIVPTIDLSTITIPETKKEPIDEKRIDEILDEIQRSNADWEDVTDRAVKKGDYVDLTIDSIDEDPPKSIVKDRRFEVKEKRMSPWLTKLLIGLKTGESAEGISELDENADESTKAKFKPTKVKVELHKTLKILLPPVDDELAKKVGAKSKEDLLEKIRANLEKETEDAQKQQQFVELEKALLEKYEFELPVTLKKEEHKERLKAKLKDLKEQNLSDEEIQKEQKKIEEVVEGEIERSLRLYFLEKEISKQGKVKVTNQELNAEIGHFLSQNPMLQAKGLDKDMTQRLFSKLSSDILERKVKEYCLSQVNLKTKA
ncbi:MAG: Trigger factor [Chlamydiae bacterium]|nr:Trigger factor [Chlamydiota bacterium]